MVGLALAMGLLIGYTFFLKDTANLVSYTSDGDKGASDIVYGVGEVESVLNLIEKKYYNPVDRKSMVEAAIESAMYDLDKYSVYIKPESMRLMDMEMSTDYKGLGIEMRQDRDSVFITFSRQESDARRNGLDAGDVLLAINDKPVTGDSITYDFIRKQVLAQDSCLVLFYDYQSRDTLEKTIALMSLVNDDATIRGVLAEDVGIIKINNFNTRTYEQFMQSLEYLDSMTTELNLIIDVRGNPGGYLPQVLKILDQLIFEKEQLLLTTRNRDGSEKTYYSKGKNFFKIANLAVLIDGNSASASEILAGVVQDLDIGLVAGSPSYGKGLVQEQYNLPSGGEIRLTVAEYITPSGRSIQKWAGFNTEGEKLCDSLSAIDFKSVKYFRKLPSCVGVEPDLVVEEIKDCEIDHYVMMRMSFELESIDVSDNVQFAGLLSSYNVSVAKGCEDYIKTQLRYIKTKNAKGILAAEQELLKTDELVLAVMDAFKTPLASLIKKKQ